MVELILIDTEKLTKFVNDCINEGKKISPKSIKDEFPDCEVNYLLPEKNQKAEIIIKKKEEIIINVSKL